jgi:putative addiction module CopG family antidote
MSITVPDDIRVMVHECMAAGDFADESDVLRTALNLLAEQMDDLQALRTAIREWQAGDEGTPLAEAFDEIRQQQAVRTPS